jgi:hypothetical protein
MHKPVPPRREAAPKGVAADKLTSSSAMLSRCFPTIPKQSNKASTPPWWAQTPPASST